MRAAWVLAIGLVAACDDDLDPVRDAAPMRDAMRVGNERDAVVATPLDAEPRDAGALDAGALDASESAPARCDPACAADQLCMYYEPSCQGESCAPGPRCYRRASCSECTRDECARVYFVDGYDVSYCVVP